MNGTYRGAEANFFPFVAAAAAAVSRTFSVAYYALLARAEDTLCAFLFLFFVFFGISGLRSRYVQSGLSLPVL